MKQPSAKLRQAFAFSVNLLIGSNLLLGGSFVARQDSWISALIASAVLTVWLALIGRIGAKYPGKTFFDLAQSLPIPIRTVAYATITLYGFSMCCTTLRGYAGFVKIVSLQNTPLIVPILLTGTVCAVFLYNEPYFLFRFSYPVMWAVIATATILFILLIPVFRGENLLPIFYKNTESVVSGATDLLAHPYGNAFLLLGIYPFESKKQSSRFHLWVAVFCTILSLVISLQCILALGGSLCKAMNFPYDFTASLIDISDFFSRIEVFASLIFHLSAILRAAFLLRQSATGLERLFHVSVKKIAVPISLCACAYAEACFRNTDSIPDYLQVMKYVSYPVQYILPLILFLFLKIAEIRAKKSPPNLFDGEHKPKTERLL